MNVASEAIQTCRAPNRAVAQPDRGIALAKASMYPVSTHWIVAMEVPSSRPSVGMATFQRGGERQHEELDVHHRSAIASPFTRPRGLRDARTRPRRRIAGSPSRFGPR